MHLLHCVSADAWLGFWGEIVGAVLGAVLTIWAAIWALSRQFRLERCRRLLEEGLERVLVEARDVRYLSHKWAKRKGVLMATPAEKYRNLLAAVAWAEQLQSYCERARLPWRTRIGQLRRRQGSGADALLRAWRAERVSEWLDTAAEVFWKYTSQARPLDSQEVEHLACLNAFVTTLLAYLEELQHVIESRPRAVPRGLSDAYNKVCAAYPSIADIRV